MGYKLIANMKRSTSSTIFRFTVILLISLVLFSPEAEAQKKKKKKKRGEPETSFALEKLWVWWVS